jgi:hypothetical protein
MRKSLYLLAIPALLLAFQASAAENIVYDVNHSIDLDNHATIKAVVLEGADCYVALSDSVAMPSDRLQRVPGERLEDIANVGNMVWGATTNALDGGMDFYYQVMCENEKGESASGVYSFRTHELAKEKQEEVKSGDQILGEAPREVKNDGISREDTSGFNLGVNENDVKVQPLVFTPTEVPGGTNPQPDFKVLEDKPVVPQTDLQKAVSLAPQPTLVNNTAVETNFSSETNKEIGANPVKPTSPLPKEGGLIGADDTTATVDGLRPVPTFDLPGARPEVAPQVRPVVLEDASGIGAGVCPYVKGQNTNVFTNDLKVTILDDADPLYIHTDIKAPVLLYKADFAGKKGVKVHVNECKADEGTELVTFYGRFNDVVPNDVKASLVLVATERQSANKEYYSCAASTLKAGESSFQISCDVTGLSTQLINDGKLCDGTATECSYEIVPHMEVGDFFNQSAGFQNTTAAYFAGGFKGAGNFSLLKQRLVSDSSSEDKAVAPREGKRIIEDTVTLPEQPKKQTKADAVKPLEQPLTAANPNVVNARLPETAGNPKIDREFARKQHGKLFLQVQDRGRVWYSDPDSSKRYEVTFKNALPLFQKLAHGITTENLNKIRYGSKGLSDTLDSDNDGYTDKSEAEKGYNPYGVGRYTIDEDLSNRMKGKLLLQTDNGGRIWYVDMEGDKYEVTWGNLMTLFQSLAVGITNDNLEKIEAGLVE